MTLLASKVFAAADAALAGLADGAFLACGGFGVAGAPLALMQAVVRGTATDLDIVANNGALSEWSMAPLLEPGRVRRVVATHTGGNRDLQRSFLAGEVEIELTPQGTFAERLRAGGHGHSRVLHADRRRDGRRDRRPPAALRAGRRGRPVEPAPGGARARRGRRAGPPRRPCPPGCSWIVSSR